MTLEQASQYWKRRLSDGKPIYRVRVRRLLELAGAERRGWAITQRIKETLESNGLTTEPGFDAAWIDGLVSVRLLRPLQANQGEIQNVEPSQSIDLDEDVQFDPAEEDPSAASTAPCDDAAAPVGESLNAPAGNIGVVETPTATQESNANAANVTDPVRRIGSIASANRGIVSVNLQDTLATATTLMMFESYSQLAIMQGERIVRGMISWESIAKRSMLAPEPALVSDCRTDAQVIDADGSLFEALPTIEKYGYVLVRSEGRFTGIVTASDVAVELRSMSYAFMSIETIEGLIRKKLHPKLTVQDLQHLEEYSKARTESSVSFTTFGENIRLLEREDIWTRLAVNIDRKQFIKRLLSVRDVRNDVMHFNPDPLGPSQKRELQQMEDFLRQVFS